MKIIIVVILSLFIFGCSSKPALDLRTGEKKLDLTHPVNTKHWNHGTETCDLGSEPKIDSFKYADTTFILRQSKCTSYEAPFIYVLIGTKTIAIIDTGATENEQQFPLYKTINELAEIAEKRIIVFHTHSHNDHHAADEQFRGIDNLTIIEPSTKGLMNGLKFRESSNQEVVINLGERKLTLFQIPGHQEESIAIYDSKTGWLLTGDTLYPGAVYIKNWVDYKSSIEKLDSFVDSHDVSVILGSHVEMTMTPGEFYPIGSTYQPEESPLALSINHLKLLHSALKDIDEPVEIIFDDFVVIPLSGLQKTLANTVKFVTGK